MAIHSSLTFKGHRTNTPSLKTLVSAADLQACQLTLLDSIGAVFRTQSSFYNEVFFTKVVNSYKSLTNFAEIVDVRLGSQFIFSVEWLLDRSCQLNNF